MKIEFDGRTWEFEVEDLDVGQCEQIEKYTGTKGMGDWSNQLDAGNTKAVIALWWAMRGQAGQAPGPVSQPGDGFRPVRLLAAFIAAAKAEAEEAAEAAALAEAEADPTRPSPALSSPASAGTPTTPASGLAAVLSQPG